MKALFISKIGRLQWSRVSAQIACTFIALLLLQSTARASDPIGVFALVDRVVLEPNESTPERIQVWGTFALADRKDDQRRDKYAAPEQGYLYFSLPAEKADVARKEWKDLQKAAGTHEVIGFGSRYESKPTVRKTEAKPADPDPYVLGWGMAKMSQRSKDYPPIKSLLALRKPGETTAK